MYPLRKQELDNYFEHHAKLFLQKWEGQNPMRHHSLRSAFKTICTDAKVIDSKYVEFFMGHSKPGKNVEETYVSKTKEGWREQYNKLERYLTPNSQVTALVVPTVSF